MGKLYAIFAQLASLLQQPRAIAPLGIVLTLFLAAPALAPANVGGLTEVISSSAKLAHKVVLVLISL